MIKKCDLLLYREKDQKLLTQYGGKEGDEKIISHYLNNNEYNYIRAYFDTEYYDFKVSDENSTLIENSKILGYGLLSTVVIIEPLNFLNCDLLVLKILFVKNISTKKQTSWNDRFYNIMYITIKNLVNNFLGTCVFYGDNIKKFINVNEFEDAELIIEHNHLAFSIYKYYKKEIKNVLKCILKLTAVLYYISYNLRRYMTDIKYDNIAFDEVENIVIIDYDTETFNTYYKDGYNILWKKISIRSHSPCYIKKKFYLLLNLDSHETNEYIELKIQELEPIISYTTKIDIIISGLIEEKSGFIGKKDVSYNNYYYRSKFNPNFENFNIYSLTEILLKLFFNVNLLDLLYKTELTSEFKLNELKTFNSPNDRNIIDKLSCFQNINDIKILTKYVYEFIQPIPSISETYIYSLKYLLFDPITEFGLLGCDFENTPYLGLIFKYLFLLHNPHSELGLYQVFKRMLDENIGTDEVLSKEPSEFEADLNKYFKMDYIGEDVLRLLIDIGLLQSVEIPRNQPFSQTNYEIVAFARLVELLMDRPENRSDTNLEIPPQNSTLPQNYVKFMNKETCEIITIKKWIENLIGGKHYIINPNIKKYSSDLTFELYELSVKKELDNHPLRKLGNIIKDYINDKQGEIDYSIHESLKEPFKLSFTKLVELIYRGKRKPLISPESQLERSRAVRLTKSKTKADISKWPRGMTLKNKYIKYKIKYLELKNKMK